MFLGKVSWTWRVPTRKRADKLDVELKEPKAWEGLFGVKEGWSGGAGSNAELYG
jgi:hypothetical protein